MTKTAKPSILNPATLLSGVAGASLVLALALAPVSLDLRGGQLALGSIAAYADEDQNTNSDDVDTNSDDVDTNSDDVDTNSDNVDTNSDNVDTNSDDVDTNSDDVDTNSDNVDTNSDNVDTNSDNVDTNSDNVDTNSDDVDTNSDNVDTNSDDVDTNSDDVDTNSDDVDTGTAAAMQLSDFISSLQNGNSVVSSEGTATDIELHYADGWEEKIDHGLYVLSDPDGNVIISRAANDADISRLGSAR